MADRIRQTRVSRGHRFVAQIRRGGKHPSRKVKREQQRNRRTWNE